MSPKAKLIFFLFISFFLSSCVAPDKINTTPESRITMAPTQTLLPLETVSNSIPSLTAPPGPTLTVEAPSFPSGKIYMIQDMAYVLISPTQRMLPAEEVVPSQKDAPSPSFARSVAFSSSTNQVAYIPYDSVFSLWLGDVQLNHVVQVWSDPEHWLGNQTDDFETIRITWGPGDHSILLQNQLAAVVVSLLDHQAFRLAKGCDLVGISSKTNEFALGCAAEQEGVLGWYLIEADGRVWFSTDPALSFSQTVAAWAFSPDFQQAVFANLQKQLMVARKQDRSILTLPIFYTVPSPFFNAKGLQWSLNGEKILALADNFDHQGCAGDAAVQHACWVVLDAQDGRMIWTAKHTDFEFSQSSGAISPDGHWLALTISQESGYEVGLVSLETDKVYPTTPRGADLLYWSP